jgi:hypothetical protein
MNVMMRTVIIIIIIIIIIIVFNLLKPSGNFTYHPV